LSEEEIAQLKKDIKDATVEYSSIDDKANAAATIIFKKWKEQETKKLEKINIAVTTEQKAVAETIPAAQPIAQPALAEVAAAASLELDGILHGLYTNTVQGKQIRIITRDIIIKHLKAFQDFMSKPDATVEDALRFLDGHESFHAFFDAIRQVLEGKNINELSDQEKKILALSEADEETLANGFGKLFRGLPFTVPDNLKDIFDFILTKLNINLDAIRQPGVLEQKLKEIGVDIEYEIKTDEDMRAARAAALATGKSAVVRTMDLEQKVAEEKTSQIIQDIVARLTGKPTEAQLKKANGLEQKVIQLEAQLATDRSNTQLIQQWKDTIADKLRAQEVPEEFIADALTSPSFVGDPNNLVTYIISKAKNYPSFRFTTDQLFDLYKLRFQSRWPTATLWGGIRGFKGKTLEERVREREEWYAELKKAEVEIRRTIEQLNSQYTGFSKVYISRDALPIMEEDLLLNPNQDVYSIYLSKHTLLTEAERNEFAVLRDKNQKATKDSTAPKLTIEEKVRLNELEDNGGKVLARIQKLIEQAIKETPGGYGDYEGVVRRLAVLLQQETDPEFQKILEEVYSQTYSYLEESGALKTGKLVFVDSCCKTYPLLLDALFRSKQQGIEIAGFFWATNFKSSKVGVKTGITAPDTLLDVLQKYVDYDPANSREGRPIMRETAPIPSGNAYFTELVLQNEVAKAKC
jgi:hypothetical protein